MLCGAVVRKSDLFLSLVKTTPTICYLVTFSVLQEGGGTAVRTFFLAMTFNVQAICHSLYFRPTFYPFFFSAFQRGKTGMFKEVKDGRDSESVVWSQADGSLGEGGVKEHVY